MIFLFSTISFRIRLEEDDIDEVEFFLPDEDERSEAIFASIIWEIDKTGKPDTKYLELITQLNKVKYEDVEGVSYDQGILILVKEKEVRFFNIDFVTTYLTEMFPDWKFNMWFDTNLKYIPGCHPQSSNVRIFEHD